MSDDRRLICGAMSGTSADGVDAALVEVRGRGLAMTATPVAHAHVPFADDLRSQILDVRGWGEVKLAHLAEIGRRVTLAHVDACRAAFAQAKVEPKDVAAIAAHGQTLWHGPPSTIQYFDPSLLAVQMDCPVVSDFRRADLAVGGQGAPLVPFADYILFRHPTKGRVILNIGGIANITYLKAGGSIDDVVAFDTGPGNCISDWLCRTLDPSGPGYDVGGAKADAWDLDEELITRFNASEFIAAAPPKSTDGPAMIAAFEVAASAPLDGRDLPRLLGTATYVAVYNAVLAARRCVGANTHAELFYSGGGANNRTMIQQLDECCQVHNFDLRPLETLGIAADAREAIAFALLGAATLDGEPSNVPSATGASRRVVLGSITPRP